MKIKFIQILLLLNIIFLSPLIGQSKVDVNGDETSNNLSVKLKEAIKEFDVEEVLYFSSNWLKEDSVELRKTIELYKNLIIRNKKLDYYEEGKAEREGNYGMIKFKSTDNKFDSLAIKYYFLERQNQLFLTEIQFIEHPHKKIGYPENNYKISQKIEALDLLNESKEFNKKIELYDELIEMTKENIRKNILFFDDPINTLSEFYGGKAWYYCLVNEGDKTILNAKTGLEIDKSNNWIVTNLALGNLLAGNCDEAEKLYSTYGNELMYEDTKFKEIFLEDLRYAESLGLKISGIKKIRALLGNI